MISSQMHNSLDRASTTGGVSFRSARRGAPATSLRTVVLAAATLVFTVTPIGVCLFYMMHYGVNVLYYDQWKFVPILEKWHDGTLLFTDLLSQHNEHRFPFPYLVMILLASATSWNNKIEMLFSFIMMLANALLLWSLFSRTQSLTNKSVMVRAILFLPILAMLFSLRQWENLLWGWQITLYMCVLAATATVYCLTNMRESRIAFGAAIVAAVISSFSFVNGLLIWPVGLAYLVWRGRISLIRAILWAVAAFVVVLVFLHGYTSRAALPQLHSLGTNIVYGLLNVGSPLALDAAAISRAGASTPFAAIVTTAAIGLLLLALAGYTIVLLVRAKSLSTTAPWVMLMTFSIGSSALFSVGRMQYGIDQALASRYTSITILLIISLYVLLLDMRLHAPVMKASCISLVTIIFISTLTANSSELHIGKYRRDNLNRWSNIIATYSYRSDEELKNPHFSASQIRDASRTLERLQLNVFAGR